MNKDKTNTIFNDELFYDLKAEDVRKWYIDHYSEPELAGVYELTRRLWNYYQECISDYEKDTPEYDDARRILNEWTALKTELENDIKNAFSLLSGSIVREAVDEGDIALFMVFNGYEERDGRWFERED